MRRNSKTYSNRGVLVTRNPLSKKKNIYYNSILVKHRKQKKTPQKCWEVRVFVKILNPPKYTISTKVFFWENGGLTKKTL